MTSLSFLADMTVHACYVGPVVRKWYLSYNNKIKSVTTANLLVNKVKKEIDFIQSVVISKRQVKIKAQSGCFMCEYRT